jgi:beta-lactamase superfamily II metal-dependent hydrolase
MDGARYWPVIMQYASAEVDGMDDLMGTALQEAVDAGPYDFIKLTHHTAANGLNKEVLDAFLPCKLYAHTGGGDDDKHPNKKALAALKVHASDIQFARTDRNGRITVKKEGSVKMIKTRGRFNDLFLPVIDTGLYWIRVTDVNG